MDCPVDYVSLSIAPEDFLLLHDLHYTYMMYTVHA